MDPDPNLTQLPARKLNWGVTSPGRVELEVPAAVHGKYPLRYKYRY